ncbi:hypothetical protein BKH06_01125 [Actinomyces naeslundii]|nr:hypothetical protein BKH06_01125 [Actinomyces naeslundii]
MHWQDGAEQPSQVASSIPFHTIDCDEAFCVGYSQSPRDRTEYRNGRDRKPWRIRAVDECGEGSWWCGEADRQPRVNCRITSGDGVTRAGRSFHCGRRVYYWSCVQALSAKEASER